MRLVEQHSARKDIRLDEVGAGRIMFPQPVIDADELQSGAAGRLQIAREAIEIDAPPACADRLDHLDARDRVEPFVDLAIILQANLDSVGQAHGCDPFVRPRLLLGGQGQSDNARTAPRRLDRQAPPTATDLEQAVPRPQLQPVEQKRDLRSLRSVQTLPRKIESRRRIGHARVKPGGIKVIAEVIMRRDILARLGRGIVAQLMRQPVDPPPRSLGPRHIAKRDRIGHEQCEQRHRIRARPLALLPRLVPAD